PDTVPPAPPKTRAIAQAARVSGTRGWLVVDVDTGAVVDAFQPQAAFVPASVAKLPTAAYALDKLGAEHRFETRVEAHGTIRHGVLDGDLMIRGGGDPELDTDALAPLAAAVAQAGITRVTGKLLVDAGPWREVAAIDPLQPEDAAYNPGVSGLSLNFNRVRAEWPRGATAETLKVTAQAENLRPQTDAVRLRPVPQRTALVHRFEGGREVWDIAAHALRRRGGRWLPVRAPGLYTARVLATLAATRGVSVEGGAALATAAPVPAVSSSVASLVPLTGATAGDAVPESSIIARHRSRPLAEILREMLRFSTNVTAELAGLACAEPVVAQASAPGAGLSGATLSGKVNVSAAATDPLRTSAAVLNTWAAERAGFAVGDPGFVLANHSGLSLRSRLSPERLVALLLAEAAEPSPVALRDPRLPGGVAQILKPHNIAAKTIPFDYANTAVAAKTGTMNFVRGLAGYITTPKGRRLAFAVFNNDLARRAAQNNGGARGWAGRARGMERALIREWVLMADRTVTPG
ncbi:MAG: D-alanyl-D-alanine carboxypeptidase, partial [Pseudomonadota bacterium]